MNTPSCLLEPSITSEISIVTSPHDTSSFTVRYTPTPQAVSTFDRYRFMLSETDIPVQEKDATDDNRKVTYRRLNGRSPAEPSYYGS